MAEPVTPWERTALALRLLAVDPAGLGGIWLRARSGPVRDRLIAGLEGLTLPRRKIHPGISDEQLYGGVDLSATLAAAKVVWQQGVLARPSVIVLPMAERTPPGLAARLAGALDRAEGHCLVALDEGAEPEEALPTALADRLAFHIDLEEVPMRDASVLALDRRAVADAAGQLGAIAVPDRALADLTVIALRLGIDSLRAPLLALRAARAHAALAGRSIVGAEDLEAAATLVLSARATQWPEPPPEDAPPPPEPEPEAEPDQPQQDQPGVDSESLPPMELLLDAIAASLPPDLLARLAAGRAPKRSASASGSGAGKTGNRRGRPLPSRAGRLDGVSRIDLIATLRAAAPWQTIRARLAPDAAPGALHVRATDIRTKRYRETSDRLLIFVVDASGSAAMTRLAEAKGAVELLLGEAYSRRDHVALVAFRGTGADLLLPPTRSLVQTKRRLAALPGGGGTPLAAGLQAALEVAMQARGRGMTPTLAILTDGRANIALDGSADRLRAANDAQSVARSVRAQNTAVLVIDMAPRPQPPLRSLAETMAAPYIPLPRADAARLSTAVSAALDD